jgi:hypothetical protein
MLPVLFIGQVLVLAYGILHLLGVMDDGKGKYDNFFSDRYSCGTVEWLHAPGSRK